MTLDLDPPLLAAFGYPLVRVEGKRALDRDWPTRTPDPAALEAHAGRLFALRLDRWYDLEVDGPGGDDAYAALGIPDSFRPAVWASARGKHRLFAIRPGDDLGLVKAGTFDGLELRFGASKYSVLPRFADGRDQNDREWIDPREPDQLPIEYLLPYYRRAEQPTAPPTEQPDDRQFPGDVFNREAHWPDILSPLGWQFLNESDGVQYWRRPGKSDGLHSATIGNRPNPDSPPDRLYVFSTNAEPFQAGQFYTKFAAYALLHFDGDHRRAAADLAEQGYGTRTHAQHFEGITLIEDDDFEADTFGDDFEEVPAPTAADILMPGFVTDVAEWQASVRSKGSDMTGAITGLLALSLLAGRKFRHNAYHPNLWLTYLAGSGSGKSNMLSNLQHLVNRFDDSVRFVNAPVSGAAVEGGALLSPCTLIELDEVQQLFPTARSSEHRADMWNRLKVVHSASYNASFRSTARTKAAESTVASHYNVNIIMAGIPADFWRRMPVAFYTDGTLGRMMVLPEGETIRADYDAEYSDDLTRFNDYFAWLSDTYQTEWRFSTNTRPVRNDAALTPAFVGMTAAEPQVFNDALHKVDADTSEIGRGDEWFYKLSLLSALSRRSILIEAQDIEYADRVTRLTTAYKASMRGTGSTASDDYANLHARVLSVLRSRLHGDQWVYLSTLRNIINKRGLVDPSLWGKVCWAIQSQREFIFTDKGDRPINRSFDLEVRGARVRLARKGER